MTNAEMTQVLFNGMTFADIERHIAENYGCVHIRRFDPNKAKVDYDENGEAIGLSFTHRNRRLCYGRSGRLIQW